jgi:selenocysteine lyase/cysteine desulfurase
MTPEDLRADIPAMEEVAYMNTGASSPGPRTVVEAVQSAEAHHQYEAPIAEGMYPAAWDQLESTRETVAAYAGADPSEVALTTSTADGIGSVAPAIDWSAGDVVVTTDLEHPAGILPFRRLAETRDIQVRVVETDAGRLDVDAVAEAAADAELVSFSAIDWGYGRLQPVEELVEVAHDAGARTLVDAVQVPGQVPFDVHEWGADVVAAAGHKWLLGPWGAGFLYVREGSDEWLAPERVGYRSVAEMGGTGCRLHPGARRFEVGTVNVAPYAGLERAIDLAEEVGMETVRSRVERLTDRLKDGLGDRLLSPREFHTGLVSFEAADPGGLVEALAENGVVVRDIPDPHAVRASVHVFNTAEDVDRLLDGIDDAAD